MCRICSDTISIANSLDDLLKAMISEYDSSGRWGLRRSKKKGEGQDAAEEPSSNPEGDNMSNGNARIMILENELVQTQLRNVVLRYGMEMWRGKTERYRALGADNL